MIEKSRPMLWREQDNQSTLFLLAVITQVSNSDAVYYIWSGKWPYISISLWNATLIIHKFKSQHKKLDKNGLSKLHSYKSQI